MADELVPIFRVTDGQGAAEWYRRLGFVVTGEHRFGPEFPLYQFLERNGTHLHLSEHKGDAPKKSLAYMFVHDIDVIAAEFDVAIEEQPWAREVSLTDPDGNRLRIGQRPERDPRGEARMAFASTDEPEVQEILANALALDGDPLNIFRILSHHPKLMKRFNLMGGFILNKGLLPAREREIVILRIGWNAQAVYEFGQHTVIGLDCGLTDAEIAAIAGRAPNHHWSDEDRHLLDMADQLSFNDRVEDATFDALTDRWSEAELVELVVTAGFYRLVSGLLNTFDVPLDDGVPGWP